MRVLGREEAFQTFDEMLAKLEREWFKVEVLQDYSGQDGKNPSYRAWCRGEYAASMNLIYEVGKPMVNLCQQLRAKNITLTRVRIVEQPLTMYTQWELAMFKHPFRRTSGEQIFTVDASAVQYLNIPAGDLQIFDGTAVVSSYTSNGSFTGISIYEPNDNSAPLLALQPALLSLATPLL